MERVLRVYKGHMLVYWCVQIMEGDRCSPSLGGLLVYSRVKEITPKLLSEVLGDNAETVCGFGYHDFEMVPHTSKSGCFVFVGACYCVLYVLLIPLQFVSINRSGYVTFKSAVRLPFLGGSHVCDLCFC